MSNLGIGARLRNLRIENNKNQQQIGKIVGVHESTISLWENDKREPDLTQLATLADFFGVSCDYLVFGKDKVNYTTEIETHWPELAAKIKAADTKQMKKMIKVIDACLDEDGDQ